MSCPVAKMANGIPGMNRSYFCAWDDKQGWNYTTYFSFFNDFGRPDENMKYFEFVTIVLLCLCSLVINFLLILFFLTKKELRTDLNMYTVNIMMSSILFLPFAMMIGCSRLSDDGWLFGAIWCQTSLYIIATVAFIKICLMTLISVDRYLRVVHSHNRHIGRRLSIALMVTAWILPAATLAAIVYPNTEVKYIGDLYNGITICTLAFKYNPTISNNLVYFATVFFIEYLLPTSILIGCYVLIMKRIKQSTARLLKHSNQPQKLSLSSKSVDKGLRTNMRRRRTTIILITIVVLFLIMWTPFFVLLAGLTLDMNLETYELSSRWVIGQVCVMLLNTLVEPFLYSFTTGKVRGELRKSFKSLRHPNSNAIGSAGIVEETSTQLHSCET